MTSHRMDDLEELKWSRSSPTKGPKRLCKFCLLGVVLPVLCLVVPVYVRFSLLRPHLFTLSPSDMKLLNQETRVSTVWCQAQELRMNSSFNAYLLSERPRLRRFRHHVTMHRRMVLQDDIKEFWGFYLLRGSVVRLGVCARHEGASFIVVKGLKDARRCSYLGELDSVEEESDEISDEFEFSHEIVGEDGRRLFRQMQEKYNRTTSYVDPRSRRRNMTYYDEEDVKELNTLSRQELLERFLKMLRKNKNGESVGKNPDLPGFSAYKVQEVDESPQRRALQDFETEDENVDDVGSEIIDDADDEDFNFPVYDLRDHGEFNQEDPNDESRHEVRSSWSSSEEALERCEGLIFNVPLAGNTQCRPEKGKDQVQNITTEVSLEVSETGFYYFIFANENEITDNFLSATFDMRKTVFDVSGNQQNCTNATDCQLPLKFWSEEHVVLEVPDTGESEDTLTADPCEALVGYSSLQECHKVVLAESVCKPRGTMYVGFLLLAPVLILVFAYI